MWRGEEGDVDITPMLLNVPGENYRPPTVQSEAVGNSCSYYGAPLCGIYFVRGVRRKNMGHPKQTAEWHRGAAPLRNSPSIWDQSSLWLQNRYRQRSPPSSSRMLPSPKRIENGRAEQNERGKISWPKCRCPLDKLDHLVNCHGLKRGKRLTEYRQATRGKPQTISNII